MLGRKSKLTRCIAIIKEKEVQNTGEIYTESPFTNCACVRIFLFAKVFHKKGVESTVFIPSPYEGVMTEDKKCLSGSTGKCTKTEQLNLYDFLKFSVLKKFFVKCASKMAFLSLPLIEGSFSRRILKQNFSRRPPLQNANFCPII